MDRNNSWELGLKELEEYRSLGNADLRRYIILGRGRGDENDENMMKGPPKIQGVARHLISTGFERFYYTPQIISFGPFHFNASYVHGGETSKAFWTAMYLKESNQNYYDVLNRIKVVQHELLESYLPTHDDGLGDLWTNKSTSSAWIWMVDGCSILHVIDKSCNNPNDVHNELNISVEGLARVHMDMLLLENQIPYKLLKVICNDQAKLNVCLQKFLKIHGVTTKQNNHQVVMEETSTSSTASREVSSKDHLIVKIGDDKDPIHLLDYLHRALRMRNCNGQLQLNNTKSLHLRKYRVGSIQELKKAGIVIQKQKHPNDAFVHPVFDSNRGILQLSEITVDDSTVVMYLNLIAYEMCPDFRNNFSITSYLVFFGSLIETPEDVKELKSCGILINDLATDKEVVDLFNRGNIFFMPLIDKYAYIRDEMQQYFELNSNKIKMLGWWEEAYHSFLRSPWTVIALLAATLGLTLTFIQTWFAIHPKGS